MEIAGHLWQFLTKNKTLRLRNHCTVTSPLADSFVVSNPRQCPAIYQQYFFFEIIKIIFNGDCWSFMAIADSNKNRFACETLTCLYIICDAAPPAAPASRSSMTLMT